MTWTLRLLGGIGLEKDGFPVYGKAAHRRRLALLALLAASPSRSMTRERIISYLWPEAEPESGRKLLSEAVYVLRRTLGDEAIRSVGAELMLNQQLVPSDLDDLDEALRTGQISKALSIYKGSFLDGWYLDGAPEFERWADQRRDSLRRVYLKGLEEAAQKADKSGEHSTATTCWREAALLEPQSSRLSLRLADALLACGEPAEALSVLVSHSAFLQSEFETSPSSDVQEKIREIRTDTRTVPESATSSATGNPDNRRATDQSETAKLRARDSDMPNADPAAYLERHPRVQPKRSQLNHRIGPFNGLAILSIIAVILTWSFTPQDVEHSNDIGLRQIAVLYFDTRGDFGRLNSIGVEVTEQIMDDLSFNAFKLVSAGAARAVRDGRITLDSLVTSDDVGTLVEGWVRIADGKIETTVRISEAKGGEQIATGTFMSDSTDAKTLERDIARFVTQEIAEHFRRHHAYRDQEDGHRDPKARSLLQAAMRDRFDASIIAAQAHDFDLKSAEAKLIRADSLLQLAQRVEPHWSRIWVESGFTALDRAHLANEIEKPGLYLRAMDLAQKALAAKDEEASALHLRGAIRWSQVTALRGGGRDTTALALAEQDLERATLLQPNRADAWMYLSKVLNVRGKSAAARVAAARALENDAYLAAPQDLYFGLFASALTSDSLDVANRWCTRGYKVFPEDSRFSECELTLLRERPVRAGDDSLAWAIVNRLDSLDLRHPTKDEYRPIYRRVAAAAISARSGDRERATTALLDAQQQVHKSRDLTLDLSFDAAAVHLALGDRSTAVRLLRELIVARPLMAPVIARAPLFRSLRPDLIAGAAAIH